MQKRQVNLPSKQLSLKIKFDEKVLCEMDLTLKGLKPEIASPEDKEKSTFQECPFPIANPFMPQCISCLAKNKHEKFMKDKKNREYRIVNA
jgi:hypothetical protein